MRQPGGGGTAIGGNYFLPGAWRAANGVQERLAGFSCQTKRAKGVSRSGSNLNKEGYEIVRCM